MPARTLTPLAKLVANFANIVAGLAVAQREKITDLEGGAADHAAQGRGRGTEPSADEPRNAAVAPAVERHTGTGLGTPAESRRGS